MVEEYVKQIETRNEKKLLKKVVVHVGITRVYTKKRYDRKMRSTHGPELRCTYIKTVHQEGVNLK